MVSAGTVEHVTAVTKAVSTASELAENSKTILSQGEALGSNTTAAFGSVWNAALGVSDA
jgi:hypothetical protein